MFSRRVVLSKDASLGEPTMPYGPEIGETIPEFQARDQRGTVQTFASIRGPRGAVIVFVRTADW